MTKDHLDAFMRMACEKDVLSNFLVDDVIDDVANRSKAHDENAHCLTVSGSRNEQKNFWVKMFIFIIIILIFDH